jgi:hypothetical protein
MPYTLAVELVRPRWGATSSCIIFLVLGNVSALTEGRRADLKSVTAVNLIRNRGIGFDIGHQSW